MGSFVSTWEVNLQERTKNKLTKQGGAAQEWQAFLGKAGD